MKAYKSEGPATLEARLSEAETEIARLNRELASVEEDSRYQREAFQVSKEEARADRERLISGLADLTEILCGERPIGVMLETTKDAARALVADNAALVEAARGPLRLMARASSAVHPTEVLRAVEDMGAIVNRPHPGAALLKQHATDTQDAYRAGVSVTSAVLLEKHRKALVRARNEGLEKAAQASDDAADEAEARANDASDSPNPDAANWDNGAANEARNIATRIRAMKESE